MITANPFVLDRRAELLLYGLVFRCMTQIRADWQGGNYPDWPPEEISNYQLVIKGSPAGNATTSIEHIYLLDGQVAVRFEHHINSGADGNDLSAWELVGLTYRERLGKPLMKSFTRAPGDRRWQLKHWDDEPQTAEAV